MDEVGPRLDFKIGRVRTPSPEMEKEAHKRAKQLDVKTKKNVEIDTMGDKLGRIHMGKQDLNKLQTRKMKGLKSKFDQVDDDEEDYLNDSEEDLQGSMSEHEDTFGEDFVTADEIDENQPASKKQRRA